MAKEASLNSGTSVDAAEVILGFITFILILSIATFVIFVFFLTIVLYSPAIRLQGR